MGVPDTTGEGPPSSDHVAPIHGDRLAGGHRYAASLGRETSNEHVLDGLVGKKGPHPPKAGGPNHQTPAGRGVNTGDLLNNVQLGQQVSLSAAQLRREFQPQQAGLVEGVNRRLREGPDFFSLVGAGHQDIPHFLDGANKRPSLILPLRRKTLSAFLITPILPRLVRGYDSPSSDFTPWLSIWLLFTMFDRAGICF